MTPARFSGDRGLAFAFAVVLVQLAINTAVFGAIAPAITSSPELPLAGTARDFLAVAVLVVLGAGGTVGLVLGVFGRVSLADLGWRGPTALDVAAGVLGFVAVAGVLFGSVALVAGAAGAAELGAELGAVPLRERALFLVIGLSAAFYEESIFRGHLQPKLVARLGPAAGIVLTAAIFSAYHLRFRPLSLLVKLGIGIVLGVLRHRRGSLAAPALTHTLAWVMLGAA